jgi:hypothetical protein
MPRSTPKNSSSNKWGVARLPLSSKLGKLKSNKWETGLGLEKRCHPEQSEGPHAPQTPLPAHPQTLGSALLTFTPAAQCSKDISARKAKNTPQSLSTSITLGAADGVTDRPAGQTCPKTASAFAGKTAISMPATTTKIESAVIPGVGVL